MTSEGKVYFGSQCQRLHLPRSKGKASVSRQKEHEPEVLISQTNQEVRCVGGGQKQDVILLQRSTPNGQLLPAGSTCQKPWRANTPQSVTMWRPRAETTNLQGTSQIPAATALSHLVCLIWCVWSCGSCHCCCRCLEPGPYYGTQPGLELITPLPPVSKYWNHRCILPHLAFLKWIIIQQKRVA